MVRWWLVLAVVSVLSGTAAAKRERASACQTSRAGAADRDHALPGASP